MDQVKKKTIGLVVACYNEHETISTFIETCDHSLAPLKDKYDFVFIFVNDGSKDDTLDIMKDWAKKRADVKYVSFSRNFGQERGMYAGFCAAKKLNVDACIPMDVDLQDPPELIPQFVKYWEEGYEYIYAHMTSRKGQSFLKSFFSSNFYKVYAHLTGDKLIQSGDRNFALMDRKVLNVFVALKETDRFNRGVADFVGFKRKRIDYEYRERTQGTSKFPFKRMMGYALSSFREFSRVYLLVPKAFIWLSLIGIVLFSLLLGLTDYGFSFYALLVCVTILPIAIMAYFLMKLVYETKDEARKRPLFFVGDTNVPGMDEY